MNRATAISIVLSTIAGIVPAPAGAQNYPTKPIRIIVAQAAGGPTDIVTRIYAAKLTELLGQQVVVDNRVGAGGVIAGELLSQASADGYTLCVMANGTAAIAPHLIKLKYNATSPKFIRNSSRYPSIPSG